MAPKGKARAKAAPKAPAVPKKDTRVRLNRRSLEVQVGDLLHKHFRYITPADKTENVRKGKTSWNIWRN